MKILLFGSTGMLGRALMKEATGRAHEIFGASRKDADLIVDFGDISSIVTAIEKFCPDIIINAAAIVNLDECERDPGKAYVVNARPAAVIAKLARERNIYFVQISTDHYYTNDGDALHDEASPIQLLNEYSRSKYAGELFALTAPRSLVVRTNIVGFKGKDKSLTFVEWVLDNLINERKMTLFHDFYTSSITVGQLSNTLFDLIQNRDIYGIINIASRGAYSKKTFIEYLSQRFGYHMLPPEYASVNEKTQVRRAESLGLNVSKAESILKYPLPELGQVMDQLYIEYQEAINNEI